MNRFLYNRNLDNVRNECSPLFLQCTESYLANTDFYVRAIIKYNSMMSANPNEKNADSLWEVFWATGDESSLQKLWFYKYLYFDKWNSEMNYYLSQQVKLNCWESIVSRKNIEPINIKNEIDVEDVEQIKEVVDKHSDPELDKLKLKKIMSEKMSENIKKIEIKIPNNINKKIVNNRKINKK